MPVESKRNHAGIPVVAAPNLWSGLVCVKTQRSNCNSPSGYADGSTARWTEEELNVLQTWSGLVVVTSRTCSPSAKTGLMTGEPLIVGLASVLFSLRTSTSGPAYIYIAVRRL